MTNKELFLSMRDLAKGNHWQTIYCQSKEIKGLHLFKNNNDFSYLQILFLNNLSFYTSIYMDISMGDVSDIVLEDPIYEDAYSYFRSQENKKIRKKRALQNKQQQNQQKETVATSKWVFKSKAIGSAE